jgi:hypothetical protein
VPPTTMSIKARLGASCALLVAGALTILAASERWWPACGSGKFATRACEVVQSHRFDYVLPSSPWEPVGSAAQLRGGAYLALAVAFLLIATRAGSTKAVSACVQALAISAATVGGLTLWSAETGNLSTLSPVGSMAMVLLVLSPIVLVWACHVWRTGPADTAMLIALSAANPIVDFLVTPALTTSSYDTAPWSGALEGLLYAVAGAAAALSLAGRNAVSTVGAPSDMVETSQVSQAMRVLVSAGTPQSGS